jgi:hypothetical protein
MVPGAALRAALLSTSSAAVLFASAADPASTTEAFSPPPTQGPSVRQRALRAGQVPAFFDRLLRASLARFFPAPPAFVTFPTPVTGGVVDRFAGSYRSKRRNETTLEKLQEFFSPVRVRTLGPGAVDVSGLDVVPESRWVQIEPGVFRDQSSPEIIAFRADDSGRATHLFEGNFPAAG